MAAKFVLFRVAQVIPRVVASSCAVSAAPNNYPSVEGLTDVGRSRHEPSFLFSLLGLARVRHGA
eukprot:45474-Pyramimonas_sp.AAC.1